jgi:hypothetical protein
MTIPPSCLLDVVPSNNGKRDNPNGKRDNPAPDISSPDDMDGSEVVGVASIGYRPFAKLGLLNYPGNDRVPEVGILNLKASSDRI